jgi:hypothetical protein
MAKVYKTARGKVIEMDVLMAKNEDVRAVGNMNVNARGDEVDSNNRPVKTRQQTVQKYYNQQTSESKKNEASKVSELEEDEITTTPVAKEQLIFDSVVEFPADVLADDEEFEALEALEPEPIQPSLKEIVAEVKQESKPKGLAGAIQKVKDSKKED